MTELPFELLALSKAHHYQNWISRIIAPYLGSRIMEIGAGIGNMSRHLPIGERLLLTESDPALFSVLDRTFDRSDARISIARFNILEDDPAPFIKENPDTIVSFNVLEHIQDDAAALSSLCDLLRATPPNRPRRLITVVPSHGWAYGSVDRAYGHFRRYSRSSFLRMARRAAPECRIHARFFNAFGLVGWFINGRILGKEAIGEESVRYFEKVCPFLSPVDDFMQTKFRLPFGQSLLVVVEWTTPLTSARL